MIIAKIAVGALAIIMAVALYYGFTQGDGWREVRTLVEYPWFNVSLVDVYVGFLLFSAWVLYRERSRPAALTWIITILVLGNLIACVYAFMALIRSRGDWRTFWLGTNAENAEHRASH